MNPFRWLRERFSSTPIRLAIVRKYQDANGAYIGELYVHETVKRQHDTLEGYVMIGASLDTLPLAAGEVACPSGPLPMHCYGWTLDLENDFLAPMPEFCVRVGAMTPEENDNVKQRIARLPRRRMLLTVQNRFVEPVNALDDAVREIL